MQFLSTIRRGVALAVAVAAIATGATVTSATVAPATASAQVQMRVICQDVHRRYTPGGQVIPYSLMTYGSIFTMTQWPTSNWVYGYHQSAVYWGWVDGNCLTLA